MSLGWIRLHDSAFYSNFPRRIGTESITLCSGLSRRRVELLPVCYRIGLERRKILPLSWMDREFRFCLVLLSLSLFSRMHDPMIMIEDSDGKGLFSFILSNDIFIQVLRNLCIRMGQSAIREMI